MARKSTSRHHPGRHNCPRTVRTFVYSLLGLSLFQYLERGKASWVFSALRTVETTVREYASRLEAAWKRAADALDKIGAAKDDHPTPEFDPVGGVVRIAEADTISVLDGGAISADLCHANVHQGAVSGELLLR